METSDHPTENSRSTQTRHPSSGLFFSKRLVFPPLFWPGCLGRGVLDTLSPVPENGTGGWRPPAGTPCSPDSQGGPAETGERLRPGRSHPGKRLTGRGHQWPSRAISRPGV